LGLGDLAVVAAERQTPEHPVEQRGRLGLANVADDADRQPAAVEALGGKGGEIVAGDRRDTGLGALDAAPIRVRPERVEHPQAAPLLAAGSSAAPPGNAKRIVTTGTVWSPTSHASTSLAPLTGWIVIATAGASKGGASSNAAARRKHES